MNERDISNSIDARLREVAVPAGLLARLREIAALSDAELDRQIAAIAVPGGLLNRLRKIGSLSDADIDGELRHVELPHEMQKQIARSLHWQRRQAQWIGWAVAGSLLAIVTSVVYFAGGEQRIVPQRIVPQRIVAQRIVAQPNNSTAGSRLAQRENPNARQSPAPRPAVPAPRSEIVANGPQATSNSPSNSPAPAIPPTNQRTAAPSDDTFVDDLPAGSMPDESARSPQPHPASPKPAQHNIFGGMTAPVPPDLKVVSMPLARGVTGPKVEGYDLVSELRWGRHPMVVPALNPRLRESRVPVWTDTSSFDAACWMLSKGKVPRPADVHTEDFLAAMDYGFPPPDGAAVGIRTAAGPNVRGPAGMSVLQIGVQAAMLPKLPSSSTDLTLVIDASAAMRDSGRADLVRRAILQLIPQLGPHDRVSIVAFNSTAEVLVRRADRVALRRIVSAWTDRTWNGSAAAQSIRLDGIADMVAGIERAAGIVRSAAALPTGKTAAKKSTAKGRERKALEKVVLIADSLEPIDELSMPRMRNLLHQVVGSGAKWELIGLSADDALSPQLSSSQLFSTQWQELAAIGGHGPRQADTPDGLFQQLSETLAGRSQVVAAGVQIKVVFDPAAVSRYRLVGHELNAGDGFSLAPSEADLRSGQATTALYEVELKPDGPTEVAYVEVSWRDPQREIPHRLRQPIGRLQFLSSWRECALPLQAAVLAAATADLMRNSAVAANAKALDQFAHLTAEMNPGLANRPSVVRLERMIEQLRSAKSARSEPVGDGI